MADLTSTPVVVAIRRANSGGADSSISVGSGTSIGAGSGLGFRIRDSDPTAEASARRVPDVIIQTMTPLASILIRAGRAYLQMLIGLGSASAAGLGGDALAAHGFLHALRDYAVLSLGAAVWSIIINSAELLAKLDQRYPMFRG